MKKFILLFLVLSLVSCSKDSNNSNVCPNNDCWVNLYTEGNNIVGDYYEVTPQWTGDSGRFNLYVESISTEPTCQYNGISVVSTKFDSSSYWEVESGLSFTFSLYNSFQSFSSQNGTLIPVNDTIVNINYFQGQIVPIVQETNISHDVKDKRSCWGWTNPNSGPTPKETNSCVMVGKKIVGPIIRDMVGDTITIYSKTTFNCGERTQSVLDSIKVIVK